MENHLYEKVDFNKLSVAWISRDWLSGYRGELHYHDCGQLVFSSTGSLNIRTPLGISVASPQRAMWIPPDVPHLVQSNTDISLRSIYIERYLAKKCLPNFCFIMFVSPFLRESIQELICPSPVSNINQKQQLLSELVYGEILDYRIAPTAAHIPIPNDKRVSKIVNLITNNPSSSKNRDEWGDIIGLSGRTIDRIFHRDTGMSFGT